VRVGTAGDSLQCSWSSSTAFVPRVNGTAWPSVHIPSDLLYPALLSPATEADLVSCFRTETLLKPTSCLTWNLPPNFRWRAGYTTFSNNRHNLRVLCHNYPQGFRYDRLERAINCVRTSEPITTINPDLYVCRQWNIAMTASTDSQRRASTPKEQRMAGSGLTLPQEINFPIFLIAS
jgi:hypothetical protein